MRGIYSITKGQLITLWFFGTIGWLFAGLVLLNEIISALLYIFLIPFILIFYTIGWRNSKKKK